MMRFSGTEVLSTSRNASYHGAAHSRFERIRPRMSYPRRNKSSASGAYKRALPYIQAHACTCKKHNKMLFRTRSPARFGTNVHAICRHDERIREQLIFKETYSSNTVIINTAGTAKFINVEQSCISCTNKFLAFDFKRWLLQRLKSVRFWLSRVPDKWFSRHYRR
jgi:hypothetical protein